MGEARLIQSNMCFITETVRNSPPETGYANTAVRPDFVANTSIKRPPPLRRVCTAGNRSRLLPEPVQVSIAATKFGPRPCSESWHGRYSATSGQPRPRRTDGVTAGRIQRPIDRRGSYLDESTTKLAGCPMTFGRPASCTDQDLAGTLGMGSAGRTKPIARGP